jgi:hypothetical protein
MLRRRREFVLSHDGKHVLWRLGMRFEWGRREGMYKIAETQQKENKDRR